MYWLKIYSLFGNHWPMLTSLNYHDPKTPEVFAQYLHETGFAVLAGSPIADALVTSVYEEWSVFFTSAAKHDYTFDPEVQSGYFPFQLEQAKGHTVPDLKEFFHLYPSTTLPAGMSDRTWSLFNQLSHLAAELLGWVEAFAPITFTQPLSDMIRDSPETLLRLIHYPPLGSTPTPGAIRAAPHEDINLITLLPTATAAGLELLDLQGNWVSVPCRLGDIVVNGGDMLQMASGSYYRSATHRVINPKGSLSATSRFSMPLFLHPRREVILAGTTTARAYLLERLAEIRLIPES
jgi:isopenicillin N synthase-like dioxygenase